MNRAIIMPALVTAFVALSPVGVALADNPHDPTINPGGPATGQPSFSEDPTASPPGHSTDGFMHAATVYANPGVVPPQASDKAVSQYDVAGLQWCRHHAADPTSC